MKRLALLLSVILLFGCNSSKGKKSENENINKTVTIDETSMLLGEINRQGLKMDAFKDWYDSGYGEYEPDTETIQKLKPLMKDVDIVIFMGTWCEDSHEHLPNFFKVLDEVNYDESKIKMIAVDEEKVSPEKEIEEYKVIQVPTFIFYRNGKEINRIVEYPIWGLEQDMLRILSGENYMNPYSDF